MRLIEVGNSTLNLGGIIPWVGGLRLSKEKATECSIRCFLQKIVVFLIADASLPPLKKPVT